jgi:hypothetical protein
MRSVRWNATANRSPMRMLSVETSMFNISDSATSTACHSLEYPNPRPTGEAGGGNRPQCAGGGRIVEVDGRAYSYFRLGHEKLDIGSCSSKDLDEPPDPFIIELRTQ